MKTILDPCDVVEATVRFNGSDYVPERDDRRLTGQLLRVANCMKDGRWRTLPDIEAITGDPAASISAQLRHLRKQRFGSHRVDKDYLGNGLWAYRVLPALPTGQLEMTI
jgi:hypothetical protein